MIQMSAENLAKSNDDLVIVFIAKNTDKLSIVVAVSKPASEKYNAGKIAEETSRFIRRSGGDNQAERPLVN